MTLEDELEIRCLVTDVAHCDYRVALKRYFEYDIPTECPYRKVLKTAFEQHLADEEYKKYKREYKD